MADPGLNGGYQASLINFAKLYVELPLNMTANLGICIKKKKVPKFLKSITLYFINI